MSTKQQAFWTWNWLGFVAGGFQLPLILVSVFILGTSFSTATILSYIVILVPVVILPAISFKVKGQSEWEGWKTILCMFAAFHVGIVILGGSLLVCAVEPYWHLTPLRFHTWIGPILAVPFVWALASLNSRLLRLTREMPYATR